MCKKDSLVLKFHNPLIGVLQNLFLSVLGIFSDILDCLFIADSSVFYLSLKSSVKIDFCLSEVFFQLLILVKNWPDFSIIILNGDVTFLYLIGKSFDFLVIRSYLLSCILAQVCKSLLKNFNLSLRPFQIGIHLCQLLSVHIYLLDCFCLKSLRQFHFVLSRLSSDSFILLIQFIQFSNHSL